MISKRMMGIALAAGFGLTLAALPPARADNAGPAQSRPVATAPSAAAQRDVVESRQYDRLLEHSPAFRLARIRKECGPIGDAKLHAQCLASFRRYEPATYAALQSPRHEHHHEARD